MNKEADGVGSPGVRQRKHRIQKKKQKKKKNRCQLKYFMMSIPQFAFVYYAGKAAALQFIECPSVENIGKHLLYNK